MQSRNGTYVNGRISASEKQLNDQDRITLCDVVWSSTTAPEAPAAARRRSPNDFPPSAIGHSTTPASGRRRAGGKQLHGHAAAKYLLGLVEPAVGIKPQAKLKALVGISQEAGPAVALDDVLPKVLDSLMTIFPPAIAASSCFATLLREAHPARPKHRRPELVDTVRISRTIVQGVMASKEAILSADASSDSVSRHRRASSTSTSAR